ncbi:MAG: NAD(P)/FAD-dependent oxidoreductase [Candidatus Aenigmatarchaeota archaeon]
MTEYDVAIVGAGSAGLNTAIACSELGLSVAVIEEHKKIGFPRHCSGLYSARFAKLVGIESDYLEHEVSGARLISPNGNVVEIDKKETVAFVVDRAKFDSHLALIAKDVGVAMITGEKATNTKIGGDGIRITAGKKTLGAKLLCGADGSNSAIAKMIGAKPPHKINGIMAITDDENYSKHVDLYFDNKLYPNFFAWKIPRGKTTEYGLAGEAGPKNIENFRNFLAKSNVDKYELSSGIIPFGFQKSFADRVLLVGDAAAQTKPLTGGGVIYNTICGRIAAKVFADAIKKKRYDAKFFAIYEKTWHKAIGRGIKRGLFLRKIYSKMPNAAIDAVFKIFGNRFFENMISKYGDMEFVLAREPHAETKLF